MGVQSRCVLVIGVVGAVRGFRGCVIGPVLGGGAVGAGGVGRGTGWCRVQLFGVWCRAGRLMVSAGITRSVLNDL